MSPKPRSARSQSKPEPNPAKLLELTRAALQGASMGRRDYLWPKKHPCLALKTSPGGLERGLAILQHLLAALDRAGHAVSVTDEGTQLHVSGEALSLELREVRRQVPRELTAEELERRARNPTYQHYEPKFDLKSTGRFLLVIEEGSYLPVKTSWNEDGKHTMEDRTPDLILALPTIAEAKRTRREERHRSDEEFEARRRLEADAREQRRQAQLKLEALVGLSRAWMQAQQIRDFVAAVRRTVESQGSAGAPGDPFVEWEARSLALAASLDPLENQPVDAIFG